MTVTTFPKLVATDRPFDVAHVPSDQRFESQATEFLADPALDTIGRALIAHQSPLKAARAMQIIYLWKRRGGVSGGKAVLGRCQKAAGLTGFFASDGNVQPVDYIITLAADNCRDSGLKAWQLEALLAHELLHIGIAENDKGEQKAIMRPHDFEGFAAEIDLYGLWDQDLERMGDHVRQLKLSGLDTAIDGMRHLQHDLADQGITMTMSAGMSDRH